MNDPRWCSWCRHLVTGDFSSHVNRRTNAVCYKDTLKLPDEINAVFRLAGWAAAEEMMLRLIGKLA